MSKTTTFGAYLRRLRRIRHISQEELSLLCGKKGKGEYVSSYERDERHPSVKTILLLAGALGLTMDDEDTIQLLNLAGYTEKDSSVFLMTIEGVEPRTALSAGLRSLNMEASALCHRVSTAADMAEANGLDPRRLAQLQSLANEYARLAGELDDLVKGIRPFQLN